MSLVTLYAKEFKRRNFFFGAKVLEIDAYVTVNKSHDNQ